MKKILVTGASGFLGQKITEKLIENYSVDIFCRESKINVPAFIGDHYLDHDILNSPYKEVVYDYVINCIACSDTSSDDWEKLYDANCKAVTSLVENLRFKNFIHFSSFSIFSKDSIKTGSADPKNLYGLSKLISEKFLEIYSNQEKKFIVLRMPIVIGKSKKPDDVISYLYNALIRNETIELFSDGKFQRNIIHVDEVAACLDSMISNIQFTEDFTVCNLNNLKTMSVYEICIYMRKKLCSDSVIQFVDRINTNDFDSLVVENSHEIDLFSFKSCYEAIDYYLNEMSVDL